MDTTKNTHSLSTIKMVILLAYISGGSVSAAIITPALPLIKKMFLLDDGSVEWIVSIFLIGYVIGQLIYGPLANRYGRLVSLRSGLILNLFGVFVCLMSTWAHSFHLLLVGRLVSALGAAAGLSCTFMLISELLTIEQAKHALSYTMVSFTVGIGLSVAIGGVFAEYLHWQDCFWVLALHGVAMLILTWQFKETLKSPQPLSINNLLQGYRRVLKNPILISFSVILGVCAGVSYCYSAAAPIISHVLLKLNPSEYGYWNLVTLLGMLGSGLLSAELMKRYTPKNIVFYSLIALFVCLLSLVGLAVSHQENIIWFFLSAMLLFLFSGLLFPSASFCASNACEDKASASSMMSFLNMLSATLSVIIMGYLPVTALWALIIVLGSFFLLALILCGLFSRSVQSC